MDDDFYEEDEPIEKIRADWKNAKKGRTGRGLLGSLDNLALMWLDRRKHPVIMHAKFRGGIRITDTPGVVIRNNTLIP